MAVENVFLGGGAGCWPASNAGGDQRLLFGPIAVEDSVRGFWLNFGTTAALGAGAFATISIFAHRERQNTDAGFDAGRRISGISFKVPLSTFITTATQARSDAPNAVFCPIGRLSQGERYIGVLLSGDTVQGFIGSELERTTFSADMIESVIRRLMGGSPPGGRDG